MTMDIDGTITRHRGQQPGGGVLVSYHIEPEALGKLASPALNMLTAHTKRHRRNGANRVWKLLQSYGLLENPRERLLAASLGSDKLGNPLLVITCELPTEPDSR